MKIFLSGPFIREGVRERGCGAELNAFSGFLAINNK
jgi:hypothetical protein